MINPSRPTRVIGVKYMANRSGATATADRKRRYVYGHSQHQDGYEKYPEEYSQAPHKPLRGYGGQQAQSPRYSKFDYGFMPDQAQWERHTPCRQYIARFTDEIECEDQRRDARRNNYEQRDECQFYDGSISDQSDERQNDKNWRKGYSSREEPDIAHADQQQRVDGRRTESESDG